MTSDTGINRVDWLDNLRAVACLMVIMIHTSSYYVTHGLDIGEDNWLLANILNSASRVAVPLFFMISGFLFFGEKQAHKKHFIRIGACLLFYSLLGLAYMVLLTPINATRALEGILQHPVFYHLWFFYAVALIYLLSPLIQIKPAGVGYILLVVAVLAVLANPYTLSLHIHRVILLPVNLFISGNTFYYLLYAMLGRALGLLELKGRWPAFIAGALFVIMVALIAVGTKRQLIINGDFADTYYAYCGPLVFIAAISLFILFKQVFYRRAWAPLRLVSGYSLAIYGFHAFIIHFVRTHGLDIKRYPPLDILYVFCLTLALSLLLAAGLRRVDSRRWVS